MMTFKAALLMFVFSITGAIALSSQVLAMEFPGASGMAKLDEAHMLIVQDTKRGQEGSSLGVLELDPEGGYSYSELRVEWPERQANDIESCFALPARPGEFLLAESGAYHEVWYDETSEQYAGRIYHIKVMLNDGEWNATVLGTLAIPLELKEIEGMVAVSFDEIDPYLDSWNSSSTGVMRTGSKNYDQDYRIDSRSVAPDYTPTKAPTLTQPAISVSQDDTQPPQVPDVAVSPRTPGSELPGKPTNPVPYSPDAKITYHTYTYPEPDTSDSFIIVLATRGALSAYEPARLHWGIADLAAGTFEIEPPNNLPLYDPDRTPQAWQRGCSDLYLDEAGVIWVSTAADQGDAGPFVSTVYRFGELRAILRSSGSLLPAYSMLHIGMPPVAWEISGVKIEALGAPMIDGSVLSFATDDEGYGGIWRPLGEAW